MDVNCPESEEVVVSSQKLDHGLVGNAFSGAEFSPFRLWLLTTTSSDSGQLTSARRAAARDQLSRGTPETVLPLFTQETEQLGLGR